MKTVILNQDASAIVFPVEEQKLDPPNIKWSPFSEVFIDMGAIRLIKSRGNTEWFMISKTGEKYGPFGYRTILAYLSTQEDFPFAETVLHIIVFETLKDKLHRTIDYMPGEELLPRSFESQGIVGGITLSPGNFCSAGCTYCYARSRFDTPNASQTNIEVLKNVFEFLKNNTIARKGAGITIGGGGDPTENFSVYLQAVELSRQYRSQYGLIIPVYIATQEPSFLKEEMIEVILENQDWITLSIDGDMDEEYHRPRSQWMTLVQRYRSQVRWAASAVFTNRTASRIQHNYQYLLDSGFEAIQMRPARLPSVHPLALTREDYQIALDQYCKLLQSLSETNSLSEFFGRLTSADTLGHFMLRYLTEIHVASRCSAGGGGGCGALFVSSTGSLYPCSSLSIENMRLGQVNDGAINTGLLEQLHHLPSKCQRCPIRVACGGPCSYESMLVSNSPYSLDPVICRFQKGVASLIQSSIHDLYASRPETLASLLTGFSYKALGLST